MIAEWLERRRIKRERARMRDMCEHDWHQIRAFRSDVSGPLAHGPEIHDFYDVYCPKCGAQINGISDGEMARIEGMRKANRLYATNEGGNAE